MAHLTRARKSGADVALSPYAKLLYYFYGDIWPYKRCLTCEMSQHLTYSTIMKKFVFFRSGTFPEKKLLQEKEFTKQF